MQVPWGRLKCIDIAETVTLAGVRCTFLDANHCPGAIMILFHVPGRQSMLHSGDCRRGAGAFGVPSRNRLCCDRLHLLYGIAICTAPVSEGGHSTQTTDYCG